MSSSGKRRTRRKRRQARAAQRHGIAAKPRHIGRSGRTGGIHERKTPSKRPARYVCQPARTVIDSARCKRCGAGPGEAHRH